MYNTYKCQLLQIVHVVVDDRKNAVTPDELDNIAAEFGDINLLETWRKLFDWFTNGEDEDVSTATNG